jgi:5-methylcytosine-specific restriction enzyme subunit McrC
LLTVLEMDQRYKAVALPVSGDTFRVPPNVYLIGNPRNRRPPVPRPDFGVFHQGKPVAVLDAKYRDLWEGQLPREMLYQLAVYATTQELGAATILFPTTNGSATEARIAVYDPVFGRQVAQVNLRPVVLPHLEKLLMAKSGAGVLRARREYSLRLSHGN